MNNLDINYARIGVLMLPTFLRKPLMIAITKAIMKPLGVLNIDFIAYRASLDTNSYSQVCYMQSIINDRFDPLERRIRICNVPLNTSAFLYYQERKRKPVRVYKELPRLENRDGLIGVDNPNFKIVLPVGFQLSEQEERMMKSFVNQNKLASKRYIITNG